MADNKTGIDYLAQRLGGALQGAAADIAESTISHGVNLIKNSLGVSSGTQPAVVKNGSAVIRNRSAAQAVAEDVIDVSESDDENEITDEDVDDPIPMAFDAFDAPQNLECAVALWKLYATDDHEDNADEDVDIVAQNSITGLAFVGTLRELANFCANYDIDGDWDFYGCNDDDEFDSDEIRDKKVSKDILKYVSLQIANSDTEALAEADKQFKDFHWDKNEQTARVMKTIPFMDHVPLVMLGVAQAIIYTAQKDGVVQTYIHEFGEDSKQKPVMYALPTPQGEKFPTAILIHGGKMHVEGRGIVD